MFPRQTCERRGGAVALLVNTFDSGSRGRGFEPHSGRRVVSMSNTYLPHKMYMYVLVIPGKRWFRSNMKNSLPGR